MSRIYEQFRTEQTDRHYQMLAEKKACEDALWQDFEERKMGILQEQSAGFKEQCEEQNRRNSEYLDFAVKQSNPVKH